LCDQLRRDQPDHPQVLHLHGVLMLALGRLPEARASLIKALDRKPNDPLLVHDLTQVYTRESRYGDAHAAARRCLKAHPEHPVARATLAEIAFVTGEFEEAWRAAQAVADDAIPHAALAIAHAKVCRRFDRLQTGIDTLERALREPSQPRPIRKELLFRLAELLDAAGQYEPAWRAIDQARAMKREEGRFDLAEFERRLDRAKLAWTPEAFNALAQHGDDSELPIFILGMWRSGTTLVEQILATHPQLVGAGELFDIGRLVQILEPAGQTQALALLSSPTAVSEPLMRRGVRDYLATLRRIGPGATRVSDKMPINVLNQGLIRAMFPRARIVRCERDPRDMALSCYFNLPGDVAHYSDDPGTLLGFIRALDRFHDHFEHILGDADRRRTIQYEQLVRAQEAETRALIDFAGVPWDDRCLRFETNRRVARTASLDQVRRPLYATSVGRWHNYASFIGHAFDAN
jgi:tetratricopeptide (TPR) repeat protein